MSKNMLHEAFKLITIVTLLQFFYYIFGYFYGRGVCVSHIVCLLTFCVQLFLKDCFISVYIFGVYKSEK